MNKIKNFFNSEQFKKLKLLWLLAIVLLAWQAISNIKGNAMLYNNEGKTWSANGPGYHK